jgi:hypothetical protein
MDVEDGGAPGKASMTFKQQMLLPRRGNVEEDDYASVK